MSTLSVIVLTHNEEANIEKVLQKLNFADEILVVDDLSDDKTVALAEKSGAKVISRPLNGNFAAQRQFGIDHAVSEWVLFLDADEYVTDLLVEEIKKAIAGDAFAYQIKRVNHLMGIEVRHGALRPDYVTRLFPKKEVSCVGVVHERFEHPYRERKLKGEILHYTYQDWDHYYKKMDYYANLSAKRYKEEGKSVSFFRDVIGRSFFAFIKTYFLTGGIKDGKLGFVLAVNYAHYTFSKYVRYYWQR